MPPNTAHTTLACESRESLAPRELTFEARSPGLRRAVTGSVNYWLSTMPTLNAGEIEVKLTAVSSQNRRFHVARWTQTSREHDETHARRLIARDHALVLTYMRAPHGA